MKLTKRETILLFLLAVVFITVAGINYLVLPAIDAAAQSSKELKEVEAEFIALQSNVKLAGEIDGSLITQQEEATQLAAPYLYSIDAEQVNKWLSDLYLKNKLICSGIEISGITVSGLSYTPSASFAAASSIDLPIKSAADAAAGLSVMPDPEQDDHEDNSETGETEQPDQDEQDDNEDEQDEQDDKNEDGNSEDAAKIAQMYCTKVIVNLSGDYSNIEAFISDLYGGDRKLVIDVLSLTRTDSESSAVFSIRFFAAPAIGESDVETYAFPNPAGQNMLIGVQTIKTPDVEETE
ncbi:MAG: hypothetical protein ACOYJD_05465 [Christensenellales bacterium]|jgi:Tfp pilus assembly protein PilO